MLSNDFFQVRKISLQKFKYRAVEIAYSIKHLPLKQKSVEFNGCNSCLSWVFRFHFCCSYKYSNQKQHSGGIHVIVLLSGEIMLGAPRQACLPLIKELTSQSNKCYWNNVWFVCWLASKLMLSYPSSVLAV